MNRVGRIDTVDLFPALHGALMSLLRDLAPAEWERPTVCREWCVKDIAAHMLDTQIRQLSLGRDAYAGLAPDAPVAEYHDLVAWLNRINREWVQAMRRVSPRVLLDMLAVVGPQYNAYLAALDPDAPAMFPVAWAGEAESANWFDIGRSYTEYWHHQQQIREATGRPLLENRRWLHPVIALFLRALPRTYQDVDSLPGTSVQVTVTGEAGGRWVLLRSTTWELWDGEHPQASAHVILSADTAWRLFTKGLSRDAASARVTSSGDLSLAGNFLDAIAIMG